MKHGFIFKFGARLKKRCSGLLRQGVFDFETTASSCRRQVHRHGRSRRGEGPPWRV